MSKYRYYINDVEVFPQGDWSISYQRNEGQIFFRRIFDGELTFFEWDLWQNFCCEILEFKIYCDYELFWEGQFQNPYKLKFDADACTITGTPEVVDEYTCIMDFYETEFLTYPTGAGSIQPVITDCAGFVIHTFANSHYLIWASTASASPNHLDRIVNGGVQMNCGLTISSSFLFRNNFANGDNYAAAYGVNNYITSAANRLEYLYLADNTTLRNDFGGTWCNNKNYFLSFKDIEGVLRIWFNAYWFIDENGDFRVEHISYFDPAFPHSDYTVGHDLTKVVDRNGRSFAYRRNKYEYETGRMYDQEIWEMQHYDGTEGGVTHDADFNGVPIFYGAAIDQKSNYVPGEFKEKNLTTSKFWSDITWGWGIAANPPNALGSGQPDTMQCPGFCILDIDTATNYIRCEAQLLGAVGNMMNRHLSIAKLQDYYHQYDRVFLYGNMNNGAVTTFQSSQKHKLQDAIEFPLCCDDDFDPLNEIRTELGDGAIKAATQTKNSIEVELLYDFNCDLQCMPVGVVAWDGVNDYVQLSANVNMQGNKRLDFSMYLYKDNGFGGTPSANAIAHLQNLAADLLVVWFRGDEMHMMPCSPVVPKSRYVEITGWANKCINVQITKTVNAGQGEIVSVTFNGTPQTLYQSLYIITPGTNYLASSGGLYHMVDGLLWDFKVWDVSGAPAQTHGWVGYPDGNTNNAWLDTVGAINGTVIGNPDILFC